MRKLFFYQFLNPSTQFCANLLLKKEVLENQALPFCICRDYWTRTSDLAPPRRVRYQLR